MKKRPQNQNKQICYECGGSVARGSGNFVNRVPSLVTYEERLDMRVPFPKGNWLCDSCDQEASKTVLITVKGGAVTDVVNLPDDWSYAIMDYDIGC